MPTCTATRRNGTQCTQPAIKGANVCRMHGGAAPQVRNKAKQRLLEAADPAAAYLASLVANKKAPTSDRRQAAVAILDRAEVPAESKVKLTGDLSSLTEEQLELVLAASRILNVAEGA